MKSKSLVLAIVLGVVSAPTLADSVDLVTFAYTGIMTSVVDTNSALDSSIFIGQSFSGSYTFDPTTPDRNPSDVRGDYEWRDDFLRGFTAEFSIGNYTFGLSPLAPSGGVIVLDDAPSGPPDNRRLEDGYNVSGQLVQVSGPFFPLPGGRDPDAPTQQQANWQIILNSLSDLSIITSDALPTVAPDINLFETNIFSFTNNPGEIQIIGSLTSLSITSVPEPGTLSLLAAGLLAGAAFRKRFK